MELWKNITGYEGTYQISNMGRVRNIISGKILKNQITRYGYPFVQLWHSEKIEQPRIHQLIARAFIDNPKNLKVVNHINGIKTDNRIENLEWCTSSYNNFHAIKTGLRKPYQRQIIDKNTGILYDSILSAAAAFGVNKNTLGHWLRGRMKNKTSL